MKKIYALLSGILLTAVLLIGMISLFDKDALYSEREKRRLAQRPKLTFSTLLSGKYASAYDSYYADAFPSREKLLNVNRSLNGFYTFTGLNGKKDPQIVISYNPNVANGGEALQTPSSQVPQDPTATTDPSSDPTEPNTEPSTEEQPHIREPDEQVQNLGVALIVGNRAIEVPYADYDSLEDYAGAINNISKALGSGVRTFAIDVPNAAEFYTTSEYHTGQTSQKDMIDFIYSKLDANVKQVDAYDRLIRHTDEYIYFRTDHHWTQLGAYYAYTAFCQAAGFEVQPLEKFTKTGEYTNFLGSLYNVLADYPASSALKNDPDTVYYYRPYVEIDTYFYPDATMTEKYVIGTISHLDDSVTNKYLTFLGGDHPVTSITTNVDGPVCVLLKESYGNAFAPWLTSHYSQIYVIDPREFNRDGKPSLDLTAFCKQHNVDDCIVLNYPMAFNSDSYIAWLNRLVGIN